jgi:hypothetical protein
MYTQHTIHLCEGETREVKISFNFFEKNDMLLAIVDSHQRE